MPTEHHRLPRSLLLAPVIAVLCAAISVAQTAPVRPDSAQAPSAPSAGSELLIASGDLLEVEVYGAPDFSRQARVSSSGEITLPLIGAVKVAGLSIGAAERTIQQRLSAGGFFNQPQVSILEKEYSTQGVSVLGEVQKPGIYPLLGRRTLFDAISAAGGTTAKAGKTVTITHRDRSLPAQTVEISFAADSHDAENNVPIAAGDTIVVSKAGIVYVVGDVKQPSGFVMENSTLTVLQAIALAQGANPTAALSSARLIRRTTNGPPAETTVDLKRILAAKAPDMPLQPDDVLFVPSSTGKNAARRTMESVLQVATGVAIYRR